MTASPPLAAASDRENKAGFLEPHKGLPDFGGELRMISPAAYPVLHLFPALRDPTPPPHV